MDPVTHTVIGMAVAKVSGHPVALNDPATMCIIAGSVIPDADILLQKWGDYVYLKNHRGVSHSIPGLVVSSMLIAGVMSLFYQNSSIWSMFLWALVGCLSHAFFDIFNSYGAKVLWPVFDRKYTLGLLIIFDPVFMGLLGGFLFTEGTWKYVFIAAFVLYLVSRAVTRAAIAKELQSRYGDEFDRISILPSMTGLFRWHFILEGSEYNIIGEKNVLRNTIRIVKRLHKQDDAADEKVLYSPVGRFFSEFTPFFHVKCEKNGDITKYVFIDMRYYIRNDFLHHAVLEVDRNQSVVRQTFHPYSKQRSCMISS